MGSISHCFHIYSVYIYQIPLFSLWFKSQPALSTCKATLILRSKDWIQHSLCPELQVVPPRQDKVNLNWTSICNADTPKARGLSSPDVLQQQELSFSFKNFIFNYGKYFLCPASTLKTRIYYICHANSEVHAFFSTSVLRMCNPSVSKLAWPQGSCNTLIHSLYGIN